MRDLSLHLMDILENSIKACADHIIISIKADSEKKELSIEVCDNGIGMDKKQINKVLNPFYTTRMTRKVGLGIPLLKASAERASGGLTIDSELGRGTTLIATFKTDHIDRLPLGDIAETINSVIVAHENVELRLVLEGEKGSIILDTLEIKEKLGEVPIGQFEVIDWMREYINEGLEFIFGGVLDEIAH